MIEIKAYQADCGKKYFNKSSTRRHEKICKCWTNPALKTCLTCEFGKLVNDSNGMGDEPQYLQTWMQWDCLNPAYRHDEHFTKAENDITGSLNCNCPVWEQK